MKKQNCHCNNIAIEEGEFGEVFAISESSVSLLKNGSSQFSYGEGGCPLVRCECDEPIKIKSYTLTNMNRVQVVLINWGATIVSVKCPDKYGDVADVVLGFDDLKSYLDPTLNNFIGCVLGRCANRIRDGMFTIKSMDYLLTKNDSNKHHLHGGTNGLGRRVWESCVEDSHVIMSYLSEDGEEGYPGSLLTTLKFTLTNDNRLEIGMRASTSKPTVVNLSHGSMFNLAGHDAGEEELREHKMSFNCDRWTFAEYADPLPSGAIRGVGGTIMDLRVAQPLRDVMDKVPHGQGFDHNFCAVKSSCQPADVSFVSRAFHPKSGRYLEVYSDQPGVQFYTGGRLPPYPLPEDDKSCAGESLSSNYEIRFKDSRSNDDDDDCECEEPCDCETDEASSSISKVSVRKMLEFLPGKGDAKYTKFAAFSVQPQNYPDAVNIPHFPCAILRPGQVYYHDLVYKFGIQLSSYM